MSIQIPKTFRAYQSALICIFAVILSSQYDPKKCNVVTRSSEAHVELGCEMNVVGFGWTNAAFLELLHGLPKGMVDRLEKEQNQALPAAK